MQSEINLASLQVIMKNNVLILGILLVVSSLVIGAVKIKKVVTGVECLAVSFVFLINWRNTLRGLIEGDAIKLVAVFGLAAMCSWAVILGCQTSNSAIAKMIGKVSSVCLLMCVAALLLLSFENQKSGIVYVEKYLLGYYIWIAGLFLSAASQWLDKLHDQRDFPL